MQRPKQMFFLICPLKVPPLIPASNYNIELNSAVGDNENPTSKDKIMPEDNSIIITRQVVDNYLANFHEIALKELNPFVSFNIKGRLFNFGAFFIIVPYPSEKPVALNQKNINFRFDTSQNTVIDAFNAVGIDITQCLAKDEIDHFHISLKANKPYFIGTNLIYNENEIILIKDSSNQAWHKEAAEKDVQRIKNEIRELPI
jgi:hypothetical protein